jgi:hypothetical protein
MKRIGAILAMLGFVLQAHAVQDIKLTETPPLQPLRWCKHSDGQVIPQSEACGSDTTEVSSISQRQPDGHVEFQPLDKKDAPAADQSAASNSTAQPAAAEQMSPEEKKQVMKDFRMRMLKWLGFALVVAVIAKLLKRSFFLWFILGFILRMVLVAANVIAF